MHTAASGQTIDASSGSSSYRVSLSEALLQQLAFRGMGAYRLAWLSARVQSSETVSLPASAMAPCTCCKMLVPA